MPNLRVMTLVNYIGTITSCHWTMFIRCYGGILSLIVLSIKLIIVLGVGTSNAVSQ